MSENIRSISGDIRDDAVPMVQDVGHQEQLLQAEQLGKGPIGVRVAAGVHTQASLIISMLAAYFFGTTQMLR